MKKIGEALTSVLPVTVIVFILNLTPLVNFSAKELKVFIISSLLLILLRALSYCHFHQFWHRIGFLPRKVRRVTFATLKLCSPVAARLSRIDMSPVSLSERINRPTP